MKKQILFLLTVVIAGSASIYSCKKKTDATPALAPASIQATINGVTYKASTQDVVPSLNALTGNNSNYVPSIANNGSYLSVTYKDTSSAPYSYQYAIYQANIVAPGDTLAYILSISSKNIITTGTYILYDENANITPSGSTYATAGYSRNNFSDSTLTGTISITELDMTKKLASGTFSFTNMGTSGSNPAKISVTNGTFTNLILQEF
jgi:hypothetical protein